MIVVVIRRLDINSINNVHLNGILFLGVVATHVGYFVYITDIYRE